MLNTSIITLGVLLDFAKRYFERTKAFLIDLGGINARKH